MAAESVGEIGLDLVVNQNQFQKQMSNVTNLAKKAGKALAAAFAVKKIAEFGKSCIELGSDLAEVQNVVDVTFTSMSKQVDSFAKSAASSFGLSETMAKKYVGTFGAMAKAFGFSESQAYDMSTALTGLAGDVASFYNITQDEAYTKLKSVFTGETESLKDLGIVMTQSALDSYAMANGFGKTTSAMTEAEKVALRYQFVASQLSAAQGDFARTSGSWANQVRILQLQFESLKATIGQGLINVFTPVLKVINTLLGKLSVLASAFKSFTELITGQKSSGGSGISSLATTAEDTATGLSSASDSASNLADNTSSVGTAAKKAAKEMRSLMGFDQINKLDDSSSDSDSSGSSGGSGGATGGVSGGSVDFGSLANGETVIDEVDTKMSKMLKNIQTLCEPAINSLKRLWSEGLAKLGSFAWSALQGFYNNFLVPVGKWTMGVGIPRFVDALNNGLMKVKYSKILKSLNSLWKVCAKFATNMGEGLLWFWENVLVPLGTWTVSEVVPRFLDLLKTAIDGVNTVIEAAAPVFEDFYNNVLQPLASFTGDAILLALDGINTALDTLVGWLQDLCTWIGENQTAVTVITGIIGGFTAALAANAIAANALSIAHGVAAAAVGVYNGVMAIATGVTGAFSAAIAFLTSPITLVVAAIAGLVTAGVLLYQNWDTVKAKALEIWGAIKEWFKETIDNIAQFFKDLWQGIKDTFLPIGKWFKEKFETARDNVKGAFSAIGNWFKERYEDIKGAFSAIGTWFKEKFDAAYDNVTGAFSGAKKFFKGCWSGIKEAFGSIGDWFHEKFSGAWERVKEVFSSGGDVFEGIKDGILDNLKSVINHIIDGINQVITVPFDGINSALNKLRNLTLHIGPYTAHPFGGLPTISTPQIPQLAEGGYVKANTPQLAMIGDNRHQGEVVAPESKLQEMVDAAVAQASGGVSRDELESILNRAVMRIVAALSNLGFAIDGETIAKAKNLAQVNLDRRYNVVELT